ncbi:hypothetical protein LFL97_28380 [Burkholderia sp. JSH-S8]|uniref:amino acid kinase family protein n=1 Tax=Burkholderia stagnalis TaxID=1503054 RepID=UPI0013DF269F|nr:hypothetical protein [Burkholderia stagnalis]WGS44511.1 hypothetical protein LFL97_28380 [Burkholderia sp. JSH-S8]
MKRVLVKFGGSLVTDRLQHQCLNLAAVDTAAALLRRWQAEAPDAQFVAIFGGGSFAHPIVHGAQRPDGSVDPLTAGKLAASLREMRNRIFRRFVEHGIDAVTIDETEAFLCTMEDRIRWRSVTSAATHRTIAIMTGGAIPTRKPDRRAQILSSDDIPMAIAVETGPIDVVFLTDVPGVLTRDGARRQTVPVVTAATYRAVREHIGAAKIGDATGGMLRKFDAGVVLARHGHRCFIGSGYSTESLTLSSIHSAAARGTYFEPWVSP